MLKNKTIIVGVSGSVAAYKTCAVVSQLRQQGAQVWVVMTASAAKLIAPLTFRTLSKNPVITDLFAEELASLAVPHITLTDQADLFVIAPATANVIGKLAFGIADDPLTTMALSATCPKILCPAMNEKMWKQAVVQENISKLKVQGYKIWGPEVGHLACDDERSSEKIGRMVEPKTIVDGIKNLFAATKDLAGRNFLITAGPTFEDLDPVRFIGNRSSGKMGYARAEAAAERGARVTLVAGPTGLAAGVGVELVKVRNAEEMRQAVLKHFAGSDTLIMAAAVADFSPAKMQRQKIKKGEQKSVLVRLSQTPDILAEVSKIKGKRKVVGFAAETKNLQQNARQKLRKKGLDLIIANDVSRSDIGFGADYNEVKVIPKKGKMVVLKKRPKVALANQLLDYIR
jgi:phosphopantothenoylcysteine decarboxylase/phosphopantothenate--cysteine ligase